AGNLRTFTTSAAAGGQFGETDLYAGATWFKTGGYRPYAGVPKVDWENQDYFANIGWRPSEWDVLRLQGGWYTGKGFDREGDREADRWFSQFAWTHEWATPRKQTTVFRLNHSQELSRYHIAPAGGALALNLANFASPYYPYSYTPLDFTRKYLLRSTGGDITHQVEVNDRVSVAFGLDARHDSARLRDYDSNTRPSENSLGLFGESDIKLADDLTLTLGLRLDKTETFKWEPSPRAALLWRAAPDTEVYASATKAFRTPGLSDRFIDTVSIYYPGSPLAIALPYKGNPNLKPSSLYAYETGFRQRFEPAGSLLRRAEFALALFYNDIKDDFDFHRAITETGTLQMRVENASRAHTCGVEAEFRADFKHGFEFLGHASWTEGRYDKSGIMPDAFNDDIKGNRLANLAPWKLGAGLQWHSGKAVTPWRGFDMSHGLFARFTGARYTGSDNTDTLRSHTVFDWSSRVQLTHAVGLTFTVANFFNQSYNVYDIISPAGYPAPGRVWMLGLDGKF
ncbi:MAG: TonB-dependent receptor, partial [Kiritimatiellaeota bacterium]|nr:TonB-dependent receptor [Kiritimatiellota bacterium]